MLLLDVLRHVQRLFLYFVSHLLFQCDVLHFFHDAVALPRVDDLVGVLFGSQVRFVRYLFHLSLYFSGVLVFLNLLDDLVFELGDSLTFLFFLSCDNNTLLL